MSVVSGGLWNTADGDFATIPGGLYNVASGIVSFAAGYKARALHQGSFVLKDRAEWTLTSEWPDRLHLGFSGGAVIYTNPQRQSGVRILPNESDWRMLSDRDAKRDFAPVDHRALVATLAEMPIESWSYKVGDPSIRHIGPMAQDFYAAFGLGVDDQRIGTLDVAGVALAAIKGLHQILHDKDTEIAHVKAMMQHETDDLKARLMRLESLLTVSPQPWLTPR